jgi:adenylate cyclase
VRVKGKEVAVAMFEPVGLEGEVPQAALEEIDAFQRASAAYRKQDWDQAEAQFRKLEQGAPGRKLYQVFLKRIADFRADPPGADWDGAYTFETK